MHCRGSSEDRSCRALLGVTTGHSDLHPSTAAPLGGLDHCSRSEIWGGREGDLVRREATFSFWWLTFAARKDLYSRKTKLMKRSRGVQRGIGGLSSLLLVASVCAGGCDPATARDGDEVLDDGGYEGKSDGGASSAVAIALPLAAAKGTAVVGTIATVGIGVAVVAAVVVGGRIIYGVYLEDQAQRAAWAELERGGKKISLELATGTRIDVVPSRTNAISFETRLWTLTEGTNFGPQPLTSLEEFAAVTYSWRCEEYGGGRACISVAQDFMSCSSFGGGEACWEPIGGKGQYLLASTTSEEEDDGCVGSRGEPDPDATEDERAVAKQTDRGAMLGGGLVAIECTPQQWNRVESHLSTRVRRVKVDPNAEPTKAMRKALAEVEAHLDAATACGEAAMVLVEGLENLSEQPSEWYDMFRYQREGWQSIVAEKFGYVMFLTGKSLWKGLVRNAPDFYSAMTTGLHCESY